MGRVRVFVCFLGLLLIWASQAMAAERASYVVVPFAVSGPESFSYLERSIPQMLTSRLYWKGRVEPAGEVAASQKAVSSEADADRLRASMKADYVVFGTVTVMGDSYSLDVRMKSKEGKVWPYSQEGKTSQLIAAISTVSDTINRQVFGRKVASGMQPERVSQMHPDIVVNLDKPKDVYLNPQFRYAGPSSGDDSRMRSQALNYNSVGMEIVDADKDGRNEVFILGESKLYAYRFEGMRLQPIGEVDLPKTNKVLSLRSLELSDRAWLIVNMVDRDVMPQASIFSFSDGKFTEEYTRQRYFLNVVKLSPHYRPTLIGQKTARPRLFASGVYEMQPGAGGTLIEGHRLSLPDGANVFNFAHMPGEATGEGDKIVMLTSKERLRTFTIAGGRLAESDEKYSGAAVGIETNPAMAGLALDDGTMGDTYYIPMRMVPMDIERDGKYEILVNRPISTASSIFDRYRFFPQSEIHSLFWDGIGLNLQWKTRRIKGSTVDYTLADANNDGITDLAVCINTHPGAIGAYARKTIVLLYPLDTTLTDEVAPYTGDVYE